MIMPLMGIGLPEIIGLIILFLLLFGAKKVPELMKGVGKGVRSFKEGLNGVDAPEDSASESEKDSE